MLLFVRIFNTKHELGKAPATYKNRVQVQQNRLINLMYKNQKHKTKLLPMFNKLSIIEIDQTHELEMLKFKCKNIWDGPGHTSPENFGKFTYCDAHFSAF